MTLEKACSNCAVKSLLITVDEITKDVSLTVTDFSDDEELEESKMLWTNLVGDLKQVLGAV